jgi:acyl carrier protein
MIGGTLPVTSLGTTDPRWSNESLEQEVVEIVSRITKVPTMKLLPDTDLKASLNVDSLQGLQIVAALEKHFDITLPDEELDSYTSVRSIVETVKRLRSNAPV